jgi:HEAT repeat protein
MKIAPIRRHPVDKNDVNGNTPLLTSTFDSLLDSIDPEAADKLRALCEQSPSTEVEFLKYAQSERPEQAVNALGLLSAVSDGRRLVTSLQPYLQSDNPALRSKAALLIARGSRNRAWVESMLDDPDPRCRSAVVDGIRSWNTDEALLHKALSDGSHRVVCSALVNLWQINREHSRHMLECLLGHDDYRFRAAATWALGACGCPTLRPLAERMKQDSHPSVRWNALRALSAIHRAAAQS